MDEEQTYEEELNYNSVELEDAPLFRTYNTRYID